MLVLDENLPEGQRLWLRKWSFRFRVIGADVASSGTKDENLIPVNQEIIFWQARKNLPQTVSWPIQ